MAAGAKGLRSWLRVPVLGPPKALYCRQTGPKVAYFSNLANFENLDKLQPHQITTFQESDPKILDLEISCTLLENSEVELRPKLPTKLV